MSYLSRLLSLLTLFSSHVFAQEPPFQEIRKSTHTVGIGASLERHLIPGYGLSYGYGPSEDLAFTVSLHQGTLEHPNFLPADTFYTQETELHSRTLSMGGRWELGWTFCGFLGLSYLQDQVAMTISPRSGTRAGIQTKMEEQSLALSVGLGNTWKVRSFGEIEIYWGLYHSPFQKSRKITEGHSDLASQEILAEESLIHGEKWLKSPQWDAGVLSLGWIF